MDTLTSINVFRQVAESGSFVAAADRLDLSTAMVSKHVMAIEKRLRVRLLNRTTRKLSLTEAGRFYLERCKSILHDLQRTELEVESLSSAPCGTLRIACGDSCIPGLGLVTVLAEYRRRYPEVMLDITFSDRAVDQLAESCDLAFRIVGDESLPEGVVARRVRSVPFRLAASRNYLERHGVPKTPEDLRRHDFVTAGDEDSLAIESPQGTLDIPLRVALRCRTLADVAMSVAGGVGIALLPAALLNDLGFATALRPVLTEWPLKESTLYLIYGSRKNVPFKARAFIDLVLECGASSQERKPVDLAVNLSRKAPERRVAAVTC